MYYHTCTQCGAALDPGEQCDCTTKEKTAPGVATTEDGKQIELDAILASNGGKSNG